MWTIATPLLLITGRLSWADSTPTDHGAIGSTARPGPSWNVTWPKAAASTGSGQQTPAEIASHSRAFPERDAYGAGSVPARRKRSRYHYAGFALASRLREEGRTSIPAFRFRRPDPCGPRGVVAAGGLEEADVAVNLLETKGRLHSPPDLCPSCLGSPEHRGLGRVFILSFGESSRCLALIPWNAR